MLVENDVFFLKIKQLYGEESFKKLQSSHIQVIGLGGVGSWVAESLVRSGIGELSLLDYDCVEASNVNRQIQADCSTLGQKKTLALGDRLIKINPNLKLHTIHDQITDDNCNHLIQAQADLIVEAIDQTWNKAQVLAHCFFNQISVVSSGGAGGKTDPFLIRADDLTLSYNDCLLSRVRKLLRTKLKLPREGKWGIDCVFSIEKVDRKENENLGTVSFVTGSFGFFMASVVVRKILNRVSCKGDLKQL